MTEEIQDSAIREKLLSVVEPILASEEESNILTLFSSFTNFCRSKSALIIPYGTSEVSSIEKTTEFTCWLLSELLSIKGSTKVYNANIDLQLEILQLVGCRNVKLFPLLIKDYVKLGLDGAEVLLNGGSCSHQCFSSCFDISTRDLQPKILQLSDNGDLEALLGIIIKILAHLGTYLNLKESNSVWGLIGLCFEGGSLFLKSIALECICELDIRCHLPQATLEVQDYIFQAIGNSLLWVGKDNLPCDSSSYNSPESLSSFQKNLSSILDRLHKNAKNFSSVFTQDLLLQFDIFLTSYPNLKSIDTVLIDQLLRLGWTLLDIHSNAVQTSGIKANLEKWTDANISYIPLIDSSLKRFIMDDLIASLPSQEIKTGSRKRKLDECLDYITLLDANCHSYWWSKVTRNIESKMKEPNNSEEEIRTCITLFISYFNAAADAISDLPLSQQIPMHVLSPIILDDLTKFLEVCIKDSSKERALLIMTLLRSMIFLLAKTEGSNLSSATSTPNFWFVWATLGSFPWLSSEMNHQDLQLDCSRKFTALSSKISWSSDVEIQEACIGILALFPHSVSPKWRCQVVRLIVSERNLSVLSSLAQWFPIFVHQLPSTISPLMGEVFGTFLKTSHEEILKNLASSLLHLFCALLDQTYFIKTASGPLTHLCLKCKICDSSNSIASVTQKNKIDQAMVSRFFHLCSSDSTDVIVAFTSVLPAIARHSFLSPMMLSKLVRLLSHNEHQVVDTFCQNLPLLLFITENTSQKDSPIEEKNLQFYILKQLQEMTVPSNSTILLSPKTRLSAIEAMNQIITIKQIQAESAGIILVMILHCLMCTNRLVVAKAHLLVLKWAELTGISPKELYLRNKRTSAQELAQVIQEGDVGRVMGLLSQFFQWSDGISTISVKHQNRYNATASFVNSQLRFLLPPMVVRAMKNAKPSLLQELSQSLGSHLRDMIIDQFQHILAYLVFNCTEDEKKLVLQFIANTTDIKIADIRRCSVQSQVNELILGLHKHKDAIFKEFIILKQVESGSQASIGTNMEFCTAVVQFLGPRLLGILGYLDGKINSSTASYSEKESSLLSLAELLAVMGPKNISPIAKKVLASLKTALKIKNSRFLNACSNAWISFLKNLDEGTLNHMIEEVVLLVTPLTKERPEILAPILTKLLLSPSVKPLLGRLPLLPADPSLAQINEEIKGQRAHLQKQAEENVTAVLCTLLKGLNHESIDVRIHNLKRLKELLSDTLEEIQNLILNSDKVDPIISDIFVALLSQCRESDTELQILVAECLGLLGAIDPARLCTSTNKDEASNKFHQNIESEAFVVDLIQELARAFLSATDASTQTCALYAMQEILKIYQINSGDGKPTTRFGKFVWDQLPPNVKEILEPLHNSKYRDVSKKGQISDANIPSPVYGSKLSSTFQSWLTNWGCSLVHLLVTENFVQIFLACKPIMKRDKNTALFLLPHLLICILTEGSENHTRVLSEFLAILGDDQGSSSQSRGDSKSSDNSLYSSKEQGEHLPTKEVHDLAVQTIFSCLDYLKRWTEHPSNRGLKQPGSSKQSAFFKTPHVTKILNFLSHITSNILAETSFRTQCYSRALMYIDSYLIQNPDQVNNYLRFLQSIYVALDDPDGVAGVDAIRQKEPTVDEQIIQHEANGRLQDALGCYERLCIEQNSSEAYEGLLRCYLSLDQPQSALNISQGLIATNRLEPTFNECRVEAAWRLGQWDKLEDYLEVDSGVSSWGIGIGQVLHAARHEDAAKFHSALKNLRIQQMRPLSALNIDGGSYQRAYSYVLKLHFLNELEELITGLLKIIPSVDFFSSITQPMDTRPIISSSLSLKSLTERWNRRFSLVQRSHRSLEPLLSFRRTLLQFGLDSTKHSDLLTSKELDKLFKLSWIETAKVARKAGHHQPGERAFLCAGNSRETFVERAKWYWIKGDHPQAVTTLKRGIETYFPDCLSYRQSNSKETEDDRSACAQAKLLLARYSEESSILDMNTIKSYYREVCEIIGQKEEGYFNLAMFYDRFHSTLNQKNKNFDWLMHIIQSYGKSLNYGSKQVYQSMPRLLGIWLDYGAYVANIAKAPPDRASRVSYAQCLGKMNDYIDTLRKSLPTYMFFIALPQLISRICHSEEGVFNVLCKLIAQILSSYPQQAMWHMVAVSKSSYKMRLKRCLQVFEKAKEINPELHKFIYDATKLSDLFLELSDKSVIVDKSMEVSLNKILRTLPRLLSDPSFSKIILPLQQQMTVVLPSGDAATRRPSQHNPFPNASIFLTGIEDKIEIMPSLQKPKKITLRGSDGNQYIMMCKPKDDLRKDNRLMDFTAFVNRLLMRDPESRKRELHIRTYTVVPLNDECGLIEWVPNLKPMRAILHELYKEMNCRLSNTELVAIAKPITIKTPLEKKREIFINKLLSCHPSVLHKWFLRTFMDPHSWLKGRLSYCRTNAVMSMVGYILGLGDRHGENILLDSSSGDTVHVDFNCLFNKGETFDWPEKVPFRLTHNMTTAMGSTKFEGVYRKACEVTMRVMHQEKDALMSVLKPFIHDPLVEWNRGDNNAKTTGEINNEKAQFHVKEIESRLLGKVPSKSKGAPIRLSVQGQVNLLIEEATSIDNLCQMYIGWAPYM